MRDKEELEGGEEGEKEVEKEEGVADLSAGVVCPTNQLHAWHCKKALHLHQTPGVQLAQNWCNS